LAVAAAVDARGSQAIPGTTSISAGIREGINVLTNNSTARPYAVKTMIVLTDGIHNSGGPPINTANQAKDKHITVHTITFSDGADQLQMQQVAEATGGNHYHAPDAQALADVFKEIAHTLPVILTD
jgi:Mg-chelatase subunit ChlD